MKCQYETKVLDGKKSYCAIWNRWTNCREAGHCVYEKYGKEKSCQLTLNLS